MGWTKRQRKIIKFFYDHRNSQPVFSKLLPKLVPFYFMYAFAAIVAYVLIADIMPEVCWFSIGMLAGSAIRQTKMVRVMVRDWRVYDELLDWDKVSHLAMAEGLAGDQHQK
jgi:hypothetical protein